MKGGLLSICPDCHPPTGVEQKTIAILQGFCAACGKPGESPDLVAYDLHDVLGRLAELERRGAESREQTADSSGGSRKGTIP